MGYLQTMNGRYCSYNHIPGMILQYCCLFGRLLFSAVHFIIINTMQENYPSRSASVAGDRKFDVYMGIDVFGRGTYGGGQWNVRDLSDIHF